MGYDRSRKKLDRHPNYILAVYMAPVHSSERRTKASDSADE